MAAQNGTGKIVENGIDRIGEFKSLLSGVRLGLVTGASGISSDGRSSIDVINELFNLTILFAPEHGVRGECQPGEAVASMRDPYTGIPVVSLYTRDSLKKANAQDAQNSPGIIASHHTGKAAEEMYLPSGEDMDKIDIMLFDIQDAGARFFTFSSTLLYTMKACQKAGKKLVVLDRPNPVGGMVLEGGCLKPECRSFIGMFPAPIRHGFTIGELAGYFNGEMGLACDLEVITLKGWHRDMYWNETGLPFINPSPNLPSMEALLLYCGTCLFSGTNVSEGRGTTNPFSLIGAPYIDPALLARKMNAQHLPGVIFSPAAFIPMFSKYQGKNCGGVRIHVMKPKEIRAVELGIHLMRTIQGLYPEEFEFTGPSADGRWHADLDAGNSDLRNPGLSAEDIINEWTKQAEAFRPIHDRYCLY